jgi:hypothetical protein
MHAAISVRVQIFPVAGTRSMLMQIIELLMAAFFCNCHPFSAH